MSRTVLQPKPALLSPKFLSYAGASALVGIAVVALVFAAGAAGFFEPENGTLTGGAQIVTAAGASGGKAVRFGPAATPIPTPTPPGGLNLPRIPWEGGSAYWAGFPLASAAGWTNPNFFPIAAWYMRANDQTDINKYKSLGFNTSVAVQGAVDLPLFRANGIWAVHDWTTSPYVGSETVGWLMADEADMNYGPGSDPWNQAYDQANGPFGSCIPSNGKCGWTVLDTLFSQYPKTGRFYYANYGKGISFWEEDAQASRFVNGGHTNLFSNDIYWYTDSNACSASEGPSIIQGSGPISPYTGWHDLTDSECHRSSNYGAIVDRQRQVDAMDGKLQQVWNFIEMGAPGGMNGRVIQPNEIAGAVMSSLIHEARGILYFKHNFAGPCVTNDTIMDNCFPANNAMVGTMNSRMKDLAAVLNTQSYQYSFGPGLDTMLKAQGGSYYIFAMQKYPNNSGTYTFTLPAGLTGANVQVLYENRTLPISGGKFTDSFPAEYSYHIYKITP